jgi:hypothetical protein
MPAAPPAEELGPGELEEFPRPDPAAGFIAAYVGKKHSGKSYAARETFARYPYNAIAIDPMGDALGKADSHPTAKLLHEQTEILEGPLPARFPRSLEAGPRKLIYRPDPRSATFLDDMDRAVGLALWPSDEPACVWVDEAGLLAPGPTSTRPNMKLLLMTSRHHGPASACLCLPRPKNVDPLMLAQADLIYIYVVPARVDRQRLAENMGYPPERFEREYAETRRRGRYWFLLWDSQHDRLWRCAPLPS